MADEKTPKHVSQLTNTLSALKDEVIMYGFDEQEYTDKQIPMSLFMDELTAIKLRLDILEETPSGNLITIGSLTITPNAGIVNHNNTLVFTLDLGVTILESDIQIITISDGVNTLLVDEYSISGTNLIIEDSSFINTVLEETTEYTVNVQLINLSVGTISETFTVFEQINISNFTVSSSINLDTKQEDIVFNTVISNYVDDVRNVITGTITTNTDLIDTIALEDISEETETNLSVDHLTNNVVFTLAVTQQVEDNEWTDYSTAELQPAFEQIELSTLLISKSNVVIGEDTTITFTTTSNRILSDQILINLVAIVNDEETSFSTKHGDDSVNIVFIETINLSESTSYRIDVIEDSWFEEGVTVLSSTNVRTISATVEPMTVLYWNKLDSEVNDLSEVAIEALIAESTGIICTSDVSTDTPTFAFWTAFGNPLLPTVKSYQWLAIPKSVYATAFTHGLDEGGQPPPYLLDFKFYTNDDYQMVIEGELTDCILYYTVTRMIPKNVIFSE